MGVGVILRNPRRNNDLEIFHSNGVKVLFNSVDECLTWHRNRISVRKCRINNLRDLDGGQEEKLISEFIQEYNDKPYRTFRSMTGCVKANWDAMADDKKKLEEREGKEARGIENETEGVICSELVALFLNKIGIIENKFLRWKRYLPRHLLYGMTFNLDGSAKATKNQGIPRKYLNKLLAAEEHRLIDKIPGQLERHRNAYATELTEVHSEE